MNGAFHIETTVLPDGVKRDLWVEDGRFVEGPLDVSTLHEGGFAVPGLVDAHAHLALASPLEDGPEDEVVRASARRQLEAGVLVVREPGSPNRASRDLSSDELLPTIYTAGRFLTTPGRYLPGLALEVRDDELPAAALSELRQSGDWVKVIGDYFDAEGRFSTNFSTEALSETARVVHDAGGRLTMHTIIPDSLQQAIDTGFDGIEHGSTLEEGQVEALAAAGVAWTPTAVIDEILSETVEQMVGPVGGAALVEGLRHHGEAIREAHEAGVRILAGTDAGMNPHGVVAKEIRLLHSFGLPAADALRAGSWGARSYLGLPGIELGARADLVIFPDDPSEDLSVLDHPRLIMLGGRPVERG
jgi:imidazolonepropionase-like amidohydrolase